MLSDFTKGFDGGFILTLWFFGRRVLLPSEKSLVAAATFQGAQRAMIDRDPSGGDRISWRRSVARDWF
jgi:hypothetical protein